MEKYAREYPVLGDNVDAAAARAQPSGHDLLCLGDLLDSLDDFLLITLHGFL
ncbi:hypothetical protein [Indioceanicola profundi]|uniref:hypothetical protein n=1 Tax=Indioceanicola profundi TaxID=2220096 RepID=UPI0013C3F9AA|nr:hypothetical protein [Indioceanicola profundi]